MKKFDAIIIGSGQGGTPLAKKLAKEGWKTALIEKKAIGGTCVNVGCTPTKTMIASAKVAYTVARSENWGIDSPGPKINMPAIIARKKEIVEMFRSGAQDGLEKTKNLSLFFGDASFTDIKTIEVLMNDGEKNILTSDKIFIDVGTRPSIPEIEGLQDIDYLTSTSLMELKEAPEHLLIIGGGYIGLEFGQMYRRFGSKISILEFAEQFLSREDKDISDEILKFLEAEEIDVLTNAQVLKVEKKGHKINVTIKVGTKNRVISCSHILVSAGRTPNTDRLNLGSSGIMLDKRGYIIANDKLETSVKDIYVIGDVKGGPEFTHISYNDHIILFNNLIEGKEESIKKRLVPYTMFTDPQLGRIGITEKEAREKGINIKVASLPMSNVARAIETGDTRGLMKAVVDADSGKILGAAILGPEGGEVMTVLQMAMIGNITWMQIKDMVIAHPLYAESLNNLFMQLEKNDD